MFPRPNSDATVRDAGKRTTRKRTAGTRTKPAIRVERKAKSDECAEINGTLREKGSARASLKHVNDVVKTIRDECIIWTLEENKVVSPVQTPRRKCHCIW